MSVFLVYFETNNSMCNWSNFSNKKKETVKESFFFAKIQGDLLTIDDIDIIFNNKHLNGYIIHDNISSDKIIEKAMNTPLVLCQRKTVSNFIHRRIIFPKNIYLFFHLFENSVKQLGINEKVKKTVLSVDKLNGNISSFEKEVLYQIIDNREYLV